MFFIKYTLFSHFYSVNTQYKLKKLVTNSQNESDEQQMIFSSCRHHLNHNVCLSLAANTILMLLQKKLVFMVTLFHQLNISWVSFLPPRSTWRWCGTMKRVGSVRRMSSGIRTRPCSTWRELHCVASWRPSWLWDSAICSCLITYCQMWNWR